ncbi:MAG: LysE family transporter [Alphaproteobacteria bacterium]|nr:LysE family transporter [Alphaproteobacteria bacterium]
MIGVEGHGALIQGIMLGASICVTLGPQSIFVLRQGIHGECALRTAAICTAADLLLIAAAAAGANALVMSFPEAMRYGVWGGAIFTAAFRPRAAVSGGAATSRVVKTTLALCFLNPQVYLEMVAVVGGMSLQFAPQERSFFALGVGLISPLWFFGLAMGGRKLAAVFRCNRAQCAIDLVAGLAMVALAIAIIAGELSQA